MDPALTNRRPLARIPLLSGNAMLISLAFFKLIVHLLTNVFGAFGYFRDELYYVACSDHMAWGYVDQPPFSIAALWLSRLVIGDSLFALRVFPAVAGAAAVFLSGLIARELGGRRYAQFLAACLSIAAPLLLGTNSYFSMNSFDGFFWTFAFYLVVVLLKRDEQRYWLVLGAAIGVGLLNKLSVLWLGAAIAAGLLLTSHRRVLLTRRAWFAAAIALLLFLPHIIWQFAHGFPTLEFIHNATVRKYVAISPLEMFVKQAMDMNFFALPIWLGGAVFFLVSKSVRRFRLLPIVYLVVFVILIVNRNSKAEYLGPMYPMLFALGAVAVEKFIEKFAWRWVMPVVPALTILGGVLAAPFAIPVLPVDSFISYMDFLHMKPSTSEKKDLGKLPQHYADMFGWETLASTVANAYNALTPVEQAKCAIFCNNYGEAGAIDFFGGKYHLPKAICGHNSYWLWGPRNATGEVVIRMGGSIESMRELYKEVTTAGVFTNEYCMPYENSMTIYICKERHAPLADSWGDFKHYE